MNAIPTIYKGIQFRSRLEATWAAFFDQVDWPWKYEPIDLAGYIPDFILGFSTPVLVEVKPILTLDELTDDSQPQTYDAVVKILRSGWTGQFLLVGVGLLRETERSQRMIVGLEGDYDPQRVDVEHDEDGWGYGTAYLAMCPRCDRIAWDAWYGPLCRLCGAWKSDLIFGPHSAAVLWARAQNQTQWKGGGDEARHD